MKDIILCIALLYLNYLVGSLGGNTLFRSLEYENLGDIPACNAATSISCAEAEVDIEALQKDFIELPGSVTMFVKKRGKNTVTFQNEVGEEAVFAWKDGEIAGQVHLEDTIWSLESCGEVCGGNHVWMEQSTNFKDEETLMMEEEFIDEPIDEKLKILGEEDTTTVVTYSVMIWYTQDFRNLFATENALNLFIDLVIEETNTGYTNSKIPVQVKKHCVKQHPTLNDIYEAGTMLNSFRSSMSIADLKNSADAAALLVANSTSCGIAYTHTTPSCYTLSVTMKSCAAGYYSFGHEIGHNFGGKHNPEKYTSIQLETRPYLHGHGHLIQPTGSTTYSGYRSILAYNAFGHYRRKNYYSNPDVTLPETGTPTGVLPYSNNAKVITENRFAMAACGDEARSCDESSTTIYYSSSTTTPESGCNLDDETFSTWDIPGTTETIPGMYILSNCKASHDKASLLCNQKGGRLFEPRNMATTRAVQKYVFSKTSRNDIVWFGITDTQSEGTWVYESDSTKGPTWQNWSKGRPSSTSGQHYYDFGTLYNCPGDDCCGAANGGKEEMCWLDRKKNEKYEKQFLCEKHDDSTSTTQSTKLPSSCLDDGCRNAFDGLGMCVDTLSTDWETRHKKIDFHAGTKAGQCSTECSCTCFKHVECTSTQCSAKKGICLKPNQIPPKGYIKSFPCYESLDCFCYIKPSPPCKPHPKCKKRKGQCYSKTDIIPTNAKYLGYCNKKQGCKCYKTIETVTISPMTTITPISPIPIQCKPNKKCKKKKGKCYGKLTVVPSKAKYLGWCDKKMGCKCYKA